MNISKTVDTQLSLDAASGKASVQVHVVDGKTGPVRLWVITHDKESNSLWFPFASVPDVIDVLTKLHNAVLDGAAEAE